MIGYLRGEVILAKADWVVVKTGGVGYKVFCPAPFLARMSGETELFITTVVREDDISLYGFETPDDQAVFEKLMSVSGVGAKSALAALSVMSGSEIVNAILTENTAALTQIPKVGKKTAQQLVLDLKDKLTGMSELTSGGSSDALNAAEAIDALVSLGYGRNDARKAVSEVLSSVSGADSSEIIRLALKQITRGKY